MEIDVSGEGLDFKVTVHEGPACSSYRVHLPEDYYRKLTDGKVSKEKCVEASFRFLLDREPRESILSRFDLPVIARYFPDFPSRFADYLSF